MEGIVSTCVCIVIRAKRIVSTCIYIVIRARQVVSTYFTKIGACATDCLHIFVDTDAYIVLVYTPFRTADDLYLGHFWHKPAVHRI